MIMRFATRSIFQPSIQLIGHGYAPQIVYYFSSALALGAPDRKVAFSVPTGNFGNVFAGYVDDEDGAAGRPLYYCVNQNDILTRFFADGAMQREAVVPPLSPSMDIQVSSNFEHLLSNC